MTELKTDDELVDEIKEWWAENGRSVIVGIALGLSAIFGWRSWQDYQEKQAINASEQYQSVLVAIKKEDKTQVDALLADLKQQYGQSPYATFAAMKKAQYEVLNGQMMNAEKELKWALEHVPMPETKMLIQLRLARVLISESKLDEAEHLIKDIKDNGEALVIKGDIALLKGNPTSARADYMAAKEKGAANLELLQMKIDDLTPAS